MLKVGIIGLGEVAQLMHLPILGDLKEMYKIEAVADVAPSLVDYVAEKYNAKKYYSAYDLIEKADTDCIFIFSPDQYHCEYAKAAIEKGNHVFIEKPVALCIEDVKELIKVEASYPESTIMVGYMRRFASPILKAKEIMQSSPKKIEYVRFRDIICEGPFYIKQTRPIFYPNASDFPSEASTESKQKRKLQLDKALGEKATDKERTTYSMLTGLGCHSFSAVRDLIGLPKKVKSVLTNEAGTQLIISLEYDGFIGVYELCNDQNVVDFDATIEIFQNDRKLKVNYETPYIRYQPSTLEVTESTVTDTKTTTYGPYFTDAFMTELKEFYNCISEKRKPLTTLEDSLKDLNLFKEIIEVTRKDA